MAKKNPDLLILNPDEISAEANALVKAAEEVFAEEFDQMKDEISDKVGYDITEDPKSESFVNALLVKLMNSIKLKEVTK